jgi:hypothetical protein
VVIQVDARIILRLGGGVGRLEGCEEEEEEKRRRWEMGRRGVVEEEARRRNREVL